jgi:UDP-N-acetylglucosamine 2-epimerase (non-hydrolysing)
MSKPGMSKPGMSKPGTGRRKKVLCVVGTRPEAIKLAPVILALREQSWCDLVVVATAQHREMLDDVLRFFGIAPDRDLDLMRANQGLGDFAARALAALDTVLAAVAPDTVLAQGDTTTVLAAAIAAFYRQIPFCHVEAGLRTHDLHQPFPEEFNRVVTSRVTRLHFAPTERSKTNLLREAVPDERILVTGNTVIDALFWAAERRPRLPIEIDADRRIILVTVHRRENFGVPLRQITDAVRQIIDADSSVEVLLPVHPNPNVREVILSDLGRRDRVRLVPPLHYEGFVAALMRSHFVLTDSGGVQEEAPALGKPVLVMRRATERPEALEAGVARLVGTDPERIVAEARRLLTEPEWYRHMARGASPYGDGHAARRIVAALAAL